MDNQLAEGIAQAFVGITERKKNVAQFINGSKKTKERKPKNVIRDDGVVFPFSKALMLDRRFRLYTGPTPCTIEEGLAWLYGDGMAPPKADEDVQAFNVKTASKPELLRFAKQRFGKTLDGRWSDERVREEVTALLEVAAEMDDRMPAPIDASSARSLDNVEI